MLVSSRTLFQALSSFTFFQVYAAPCAYGDIKLNEVHPDGDPEDYIELINVGSASCSLEGWEIHDAKTHVDGIAYDSTKAADKMVFGVVELAAGAIWFGEEGATGSFDFGIGKGGEQVILVAPDGQKDIHNIHEYGDDMETAGHSLQRCADGTYGWLAPTKDAANTCTSACADTPLPACAAGDVVVAEVHPDGSPEDYIELLNIGSTTCTLDGWHLGDAKTHPDGSDHAADKLADGHVFGCDVVLGPGEWWYGLEGNSDSKDTFSFGVSKSGEEVILQPPTGASTILNVPAWDGTANAGMSYQRCGTEYCFATATQDAANGDCSCAPVCPEPSTPACAVGDVVVAEVHPDGTPEDYIELLNIGSTRCTLEGWHLGDAKTHPEGSDHSADKLPDGHVFGCDVILGAGEFWYGLEGDSDAKDTFSFGVSKSGEEVILEAPNAVFTTLNVPAWDETANAGMSYQRCGTTYCFAPATQNAANGNCEASCYVAPEPTAKPAGPIVLGGGSDSSASRGGLLAVLAAAAALGAGREPQL